MQTDSETIKRRYDRIAPFFDGMEACVEGLFFRRWRKRLWAKVQGEHVLEVGVGTGKSFAFYPTTAQITAIDFSPAMLKQAAEKARRNQITVALNLMDVESLCYADNCFDTVVASFVFCSVPHPHKGLKELLRVCKPGGKVILLEHVLSSRPPLAWLMNKLNPLLVKSVGANINRQTLKSLQACGFSKIYVDATSGDIVKLIEGIK